MVISHLLSGRRQTGVNCRYQITARFDPETGGGPVNERYGDFSPVGEVIRTQRGLHCHDELAL
jgi:hypothetical protein